MSLDPATNSLAVTGGEDDKAYVWRVSDGEVLLECTGELLKVDLKLCSHKQVGILLFTPIVNF